MDKALLFQVPNNYIGPSDAHLHGRSLCSVKALDWWIQKAETPSKEIIGIIDVLCRKHDKSVADYYKIKWHETTFQFGKIEIERVHTKTQVPIIDIPNSLRNEAIIQAFLPDSTISREYEYIDSNVLIELRNKLGELTTPHMSWASQLRVLKCQLDPKVRCMPSFSGLSENLVEIKHALIHYNFKATRMPTESSAISHKGLRIVAQHICQKARQMKSKREDIVDCLENTIVEGRTLISLLRDSSSPKSDPYINYLKCIIGEPVSMTAVIGGVTFSPYPGRISINERSNASGKKYKVYMGLERVSFKSEHCRGTFVHDGPLLISMTSNAPDKLQLRNAVAAIATSCRFGYEKTKAKFPSKMRAEALKHCKEQIHEFLELHRNSG